MHLELPNRPGARVGIHMPPAIVGRWENGEEVGNGLPPYEQIEAFPVDDYPALPEEWARSGDGMRSHVIGLKNGKGMWFDFRALTQLDREMAVRLAVQGVCALTGHPTDAENGGDEMALIQFRNRCLRHPHVAFGPDRFCSECGYKWPAQNYLSTTGTDARFGVVLWLDGFCKTTGKVHQFLVTANTADGVAFQILGDRRKLYFEVALYESVKPKPPPVAYRSSSRFLGGGLTGGGAPESFGGFLGGGEAYRGGPSRGFEPVRRSMRAAEVEQLEIGAGAVINQVVGVDPNPIGFWEPRPVGSFRIYYMPESQLAPIIAAGRSSKHHREGFLGGLRKVGDPHTGGGNTTT